MNQRDLTVPGLIHDLNNVFQTLVDAADLLSEDARWAPISAAILRSVERGKRITSSLERSDAKSGDPGAPFQTILDHAIAFMEDSMLGVRGQAVQFVCDVDPSIELQRNWAWERVLINLFLNSVRAMPQGGVIEVRAHRRDSDIVVVVRDQGSGIAPEILDRVFEPGVSTKSSGGLGLHVVETIVEEDGGTVTATNRTDGPGAEFTIAIPGK